MHALFLHSQGKASKVLAARTRDLTRRSAAERTQRQKVSPFAVIQLTHAIVLCRAFHR
jgi:hypothetical protein